MSQQPAKYQPRSIQDRLNLIRFREKLASDYKLALFLGIGETALANYRKGRSLPDVEAALKISRALGEDPSLFLVELEAMRAKTTTAKVAWGAVVGLLATVLEHQPGRAAEAGGGGSAGRLDITSVAHTASDPDQAPGRARKRTQYASYLPKLTAAQLLARAVHALVGASAPRGGFTPA